MALALNVDDGFMDGDAKESQGRGMLRGSTVGSCRGRNAGRKFWKMQLEKELVKNSASPQG